MHTIAPDYRRRNRVFKALNKPMTYLGVERTAFFFVCISAVAAFNLFNSLAAGLAIFAGGYVIGYRLTHEDPALLRIVGRAEKNKQRYDASKLSPLSVEVR